MLFFELEESAFNETSKRDGRTLNGRWGECWFGRVCPASSRRTSANFAVFPDDHRQSALAKLVFFTRRTAVRSEDDTNPLGTARADSVNRQNALQFSFLLRIFDAERAG